MLQSVQDFKKNSISRINKMVPAITKLMGLALIFYALMGVYSDCINLHFIQTSTVVVSVIEMVFATLILIDFSFNVTRTMGLYAIAIAISRMFKYFPGLNPPEGITFIFSLIMSFFAINMCITGYTFLKGSVRGRFGMMFNSYLMLILTACSILFENMDLGYDLQYVLVHRADEVAIMILYAILICMLSSAPIRMATNEEKNVRTLRFIRLTHACSNKSYITEDTADVLLDAFSDRSSWVHINDSSPVEDEFKFKLFHKSDEYSYITVQKWKDSNELYFTLCAHNSGSLTDAYRFKIDTVIMDDDEKVPTILLQNNDGIYMRINVKKGGTSA